MAASDYDGVLDEWKLDLVRRPCGSAPKTVRWRLVDVEAYITALAGENGR